MSTETMRRPLILDTEEKVDSFFTNLEKAKKRALKRPNLEGKVKFINSQKEFDEVFEEMVKVYGEK